jgi:hypothetical protein
MAIIERVGMPKLEDGFHPEFFSLTLGEMHTCWRLPVNVQPAD